jgi:hypothetical protein
VQAQVSFFRILFLNNWSLHKIGQGEFDQSAFERLLAEWIVACDQPFDEVDAERFRKMLQYAHRPSVKPLNIPHRTAIRTRIMNMGEDTVNNIKQMFSVRTKFR